MAEFREYLVMLNSDPSDARALAELQKLAGTVIGSPEASTALDEARQHLLGKGALETVVELFDVELAHVQGEREAQLLLRKGQVIFDELLNESSGLECIGAALRLAPDNEEARDLFQHLELVKANWQPIVDKFLAEAEATTEDSLATSLYRAAAETYARYQPEAPEVEQYLRKALEVDSKNQRAAMQLTRLLGKSERWQELREHLQSCVEHTEKADLRNAYWVRLADLAAGPLGEPDLAIEAMRNVIAAEPGNSRALGVLLGHYESQENWAAAVTLYANALKVKRRAGNPETEIDMLIQIGMLHWKRLGDMDAAEEYFARLRKLSPAHPLQIDFYREFYVARDEAGKLMQLYRQALKSVGKDDTERKQRLMVELAQLSEGSMDNPEKAIDSWKSILRADPNNTEATESLRRLYERTGKWNALLDLIKDEVERYPAEDKNSRIEGLIEIADIYRERLNLDVMVVNTYNSILSIDPNNRPVLDALAERYKELGRWNDLIAVLGRKADLEDDDPAAKIAILGEIASLWIDRFGNYAQAVKPLEDLLELDPGNAGALGRLKEIYTRRRQWRALIALLGREADVLPVDERRKHFADMAQLAGQKLGDSRLAINIWNRVLELPGSTTDPDNIAADMPEVYDALCALYEREKRYLALAEILARKRMLAVTPEAAIPVLERLGALYAERVDAPERAAAVYREILQLKPDHHKAARVLRELYAAAHDYDALESLYGGLGQWEDLVETYFSISDRFQDRADTIHLIERAGRIAQEHITNPDKVIRVFERLQSVDANHLGAARALLPLYRRAGKWARLLSIHEIIYSHTDEADRLPLIDEIRRLCEEQLGSKSLAFQWAAKAFEIRPEDPEIFAELKRLGAEADAWHEVAKMLAATVDKDGLEDAQKLSLLRELARIVDQRLHKPELAQEYHRRVLDLRPDDRDAMDALEELASHQNEWPVLLEILKRRVALESDGTQQADLLFKIAHIEEERQNDSEAAGRTYNRILDLDPVNRRAMRALARISEERKDWAALAAILERELGATGDPDAEGALYLRLGELYHGPLDRPDEAREAYKKCLALTPGPDVYLALESYLDSSYESAVREEVAALLQPVFEQAGDHGKLARTIEILLDSADDEQRITFERRLAGLYEGELNQPAQAYEASARLLLLDPEDSQNRTRLDTLAKQLSRCDDLQGTLLAGLEACDRQGCDESVKLSIAIDLAVLCDDVLDKPDDSERAWQRVLDLDSSHAGAYHALALIYRRTEKWHELRALIEAHVERSLDAEERVRSFWQIAELCEGQLDDLEGAERAFAGIVEADPEQSRAFDALAHILENGERYGELDELLARRADNLGPDALAANSLRRAQLRADHLGDVEGAVDILEEMLSGDPNEARARSLCERLLSDTGVRMRLARLLEPLYEADQDWLALCGVVKMQAELADLEHEAFELLARAAELEEAQLSDSKQAFATWLAALAKQPAEERAVQALLRLAAEVGSWDVLLEAVTRAVDAVDSGDLSSQGRLLRVSADVAEFELGDSDAAVSALERMLAIDMADPDSMRHATTTLDRLYGASEQLEKQRDVLRKASEWAESSEERRRLLTRIAQLEEDALGDVDAALRSWELVLIEDPEDASALASAERLHQAAGQYREMTDIVRRRVDLLVDAAERATELQRLAQLYVAKLDAPSEAIACLLEVLDLDVDHGPILDSLARLYRGEHRYDDLLDVLERRTIEAEGPARAALLFEAGELLVDQLHRSSEALEHFADVLRLDVEHAGARARILEFVADIDLRQRAAEILDPLFEAAGETDALISLLETLCQDNDDQRSVMVHLRRIARLREQSGNAAAAFEVVKRAARVSLAEPELPDVLADLQRLAAENEALDVLVGLYREIAPDVFDGDLQRRLYLDIADLSRAVLQDDTTAREYYQLVVDAQPDDPRALRALEGLCRDSEDYHALYGILIQKVEFASHDLEAQAAALTEAGMLCVEKLNRPEDAVMHLEQVLELTPDARDVASSLQAVYRAAERWHDLAEFLESRLGFAMSVQEAVDLRFLLGALHEEKLNDPDGAVENYGAAIGGDPNHANAMAALERLLDDPGTRAAVADILEPIHVARQNWPQLVRIYEIKLEAADDPVERLRITRYIARLHEDQLEDLEGAFRWLGRVFRESPRDKNIRVQLERLANVLQCWERLAEVYQEYLDDEGGDSPELREVAETVAEIYNKRLNHVEKALQAYKRVLQMEPGDLQVFARTEAMLNRAERWHELVGLYEEVVHASFDDARRQEIYIKLATVQEKRLDDNGRATDALRALLEINPDNEGAIAELDRLLQAQSNWYELAELLISRIERASTDEQLVESRLRLAQIRERRLDDVVGAIEQYELVLPLAGGELALTALERLIVDEQHRERIAEILEPVYRERDWWQKLVVILDAQLSYADDPSRRGAMLREIAELHEQRGGDLNLALEALGKAWLEEINDDELYERFIALGKQLGSSALLIRTLEAGIKDQFDYELVGKVLLELARIEEKDNKNVPGAIGHLRRLLEMSDDHLEGLAEMDRLLSQQTDWDGLVKIVARRAELASDSEHRLKLLKRVAVVHEVERSDRPAAIEAYKIVLHAEGGEASALDALDRLYQADESWPELAQVLLSKIDSAAEPVTRRMLHFELAEIYEHKLHEVYEAIAQLRAVLDADADDAQALGELRRIYESESMWQDMLDIVDRQTQLATADRKVEHAFTGAALAEEQLVEIDQAIERYAKVLELDQDHAAARAALERHSHSEDFMARACDILEAVYRAESNFDCLAAVIETRIAAEADPGMRANLFASLAELHELSRSDLGAAFAIWARALKDAPEDSEVQQQLERLAAARGSWQDLGALYEEILASVMDGQLEYLYASKLGALYEDDLGELGKAAERYERALLVADDEAAPLSALARIYERNENYEELAGTYRRLTDVTLDEAEQAIMLFNLGNVLEQRLARIPDAIAAYRDVLEREPSHLAARAALEHLVATRDKEERTTIIAILEPLYEQDADWARLVDLLGTKNNDLDDGFERAQLYARIAELCEQELSDPTRALDAVGGWLAEDPRSEEALAELQRLGDLLGRHGEVAARLDGIISVSDAQEVKVRLGQCCTLIKLDKMGDPEGAMETIEALLEIDRDDTIALSALQRVCRSNGDVQRLAETQWHRAQLTYDPAVKRELLGEAAQLRLQLGLIDGGIEAWRSVLQDDEADREAQSELASLYRQTEAWVELVEILKLSSRYAVDAESDRRARTEIATIYAETLDDLEQGVEAWRSVLDLDPTSLEALHALESLHRRREDFLAVQEILQRRVDVSETDEQRIAVYLRLSQVAEMDREAPEEAADFLQSILDIDGGHEQAIAQLERILGKLERWHDVVDLYQRRAEQYAIADDVASELRVLAQAAELWESKLDNPDEAAEILEKILVRDPNSVGALTRLAKIYEGASDWERCGEILEKALALGPQGRDAADLYVRLGEVARNKDGDEAKAQDYYGQALHHDGYQPIALERIEQAARDKDDWILVADMVRRRYEITEDPKDKLELTVELAELYGERLGQPLQVIPLLESAREAAPEDTRILGPLADLYFHAGRHAEAVPMYERLAADAKKSRRMKDVASYQQRLGSILLAQGNTAEATTALEQAFRVDPTNVRTMVGLGQLYMGAQDWDKARRVYRSMVLQNIDPAIGISKADVYFHLGEIHLALAETPKAKDMFQRALAADGDHEKAKAALAGL